MVRPKTEEEIELLRINGELVSKTLAEVGKWVAPGVTTEKLNEVAETFIRDHGAIPSFKGFEGFPAALCISVNDVVVHGFPSDYVLKEGDIVSVDCGTLYKGYNGDSAYTFPVGEVDAETRKLLDVTKASLYKGIEQAVAGNRTGDIGYAVQSYAESYGFSVVRELEGHGLGRDARGSRRPELRAAGPRRSPRGRSGHLYRADDLRGRQRCVPCKKWLGSTHRRPQERGPLRAYGCCPERPGRTAFDLRFHRERNVIVLMSNYKSDF